MADRIKGITVQIGGDTAGLSKALAGINRQISGTQTQLKDVERLLKLDPTNTKLLEQKQRLLAGAVQDTKSKLESLKSVEGQLQNQLKSGTITQQQYDGAMREIAATESQLKSLESQMQKFGSVAAQQLEAVGAKVQNVGGKISGAGQAFLPVTAAVTAVGTASVKTAANFDSSMSKVRALSGAGEEDFQKLRDTALAMGRDTAFSASEAADALGYMALAGWDTAQSTEALPAVLNLAAASGMDLAAASDMVTDYLSAFGLEADRASYFTDLMAYAQAHSNTSAQQLGEAYKNCAANLHAAGQDVETVTSLLEAMANQGMKGSEAGTAMAAIMRDITQKMEDGAIKIGETKVAVQDANGNFRDLTDILRDVEKATDGMGTAQKSAALQATFTADSTKGLNEIFTEGMDTVTQYEEALRKSNGTAGDQADTMLDNLNGQLTLLKSAAENASIAIGDTLTPMISRLVSWVNQAVEWFNSLDDGQKQWIVTLALVAAAIGPLLIFLGTVVTSVGSLITAAGKLHGFVTGTAVPGIQAACSKLFTFLAANPTLFIIALVTAAVIALVALIATKGDEIQALLQKVDDFLQGIFVTDWTTVFGPVLGDILNGFFANVKNIWNSIKQTFDGIIDFIRGVFTGDWERAWNGVKEIFGGIFNGLKAVAKQPINAIIGLVNGAISGINSVIRSINKLPGVNIGQIGKIPYLAQGGIVTRGSAIVGEAGPELLTVAGGRTIVQPLTGSRSTTNSTNYGGVTLNVYGAPGQDEHALARIVMEEMQAATQRKGAVFA